MGLARARRGIWGTASEFARLEGVFLRQVDHLGVVRAGRSARGAGAAAFQSWTILEWGDVPFL